MSKSLGTKLMWLPLPLLVYMTEIKNKNRKKNRAKRGAERWEGVKYYKEWVSERWTRGDMLFSSDESLFYPSVGQLFFLLRENMNICVCCESVNNGTIAQGPLNTSTTHIHTHTHTHTHTQTRTLALWLGWRCVCSGPGGGSWMKIKDPRCQRWFRVLKMDRGIIFPLQH